VEASLVTTVVSDLPYALAAAAMMGLNLFVLLRVLPRDGGSPTLAQAFLSGYVLVASSLFWIGLPWAILQPNLYSWLWVLQLMMIPMPAPFLWMMAALYKWEQKRLPARGGLWPLLLVGALLANELFMAIAFSIGTGGPTTPLAAVVGSALNSVWFVVPMIATMVALLAWVPVSPFERRVLAGLTAAMAVAPLFALSPILAAAVMAAVMTGAFIVIFEELGRRTGVPASELLLAVGVAAGFAAMAVAELLTLLDPGWAPDGLPFAVTSVALMFGEALVLVRRGMSATESPASPPEPWTASARKVTALLGFGFAADWFMAAGILVALGGFAGLSLPGFGPSLSMGVVTPGLVAGILVLSFVTASPFFLGLMGLEMGALVLRRIQRNRHAAQRARLSLALGTYGVYTVLAPALIGGWTLLPGTWPNVGAFGPVAPQFLLAIVGSYAIFGSVVFLFGRRAYCSVVCTSAVMYGGTLPQALIPTIREAPLARRNVLGSRWRGASRYVAGSAWALFGIVIGLSLASSLGVGPFQLGGVDLAVLYAAAVWNCVWYLAFVAIPFLGMSPCRNWGFCTTGTLYGAISVFGFYRKEVFDKTTCQKCVTRDCGKACEVGLVDMPAALARDGRFRSIKCVGAHDCQEACPYGNLISRDVRDPIRSLLGLPDRYHAQRARFEAGIAGGFSPHRVAPDLRLPPVPSAQPE
jgi:polyferredoxin